MSEKTYGIDIPTAKEAKKAIKDAREAEIKSQLQNVAEAIKKAIADKSFPLYYSKELCDEVRGILADKGYEVSYETDYHDSYYRIDIDDEEQ